MVEETFQAGKGQVLLDRHLLRRRTGWHRFTVLAMLAVAFLAACAAGTPPTSAADPYQHARSDQGRSG